jgi:trans-aconitate methyltransferase
MTFFDSNKNFWKTQTSSLQRYSTDAFYNEKALEHISIIDPAHLKLNTIDLGCGAGELLNWFIINRNSPVRTLALDYSETMLKVARDKITNSNIEFICADIFEYLPASKSGLWMTCQAINQYMIPDQQLKFIKMFAENKYSKALYLFDCIDPIRYTVLELGCKYSDTAVQKSISIRNILRSIARAIKIISKLSILSIIHQKYHPLSVGMGYGFSPLFWRVCCKVIGGMKVNIISSRYYEYRYHVIITKNE